MSEYPIARTTPEWIKKNLRPKTTALVAAATAGVLLWPGLASANGPGAHGLTPVVESNVAVEGPIRINVRDDARVITTHIKVAPGGHTAWHHHPGPHFVSVRSGTVEVHETDCTPRGTFGVGQGFFDPGSGPSHVHASRDVHSLKNSSKTVPAEIVITDIREGGQPTAIFVKDHEQLPGCP